MFSNYFKTTFRSFSKYKSSFFINVVGLSIGMACSILIMLWVLDELNYDRVYEETDKIYQVMEHQHYSDNIGTTISTPGILAPALKEEIPEIEYAATYTWNVNFLFTKEEKSLKESGIYARPDFFHIFSLPLISGNIDELINAPNSVAVSEELASKYFPNENPVGKSITINGDDLHTVTGVFKNIPENASIRFDYVLPFEDWLKNNDWATSWGNNGPRTVVKLSDNVNVATLNAKIQSFIKEKDDDDSNVDLFVYPYADRYLYGSFENAQLVGGRIDYVRLFSLVAIFILIIACINFMNLSTAKAGKKAKEIGVRKSIGATKNSLINQFIGESMIITFFSLIVSVLVVQFALPLFNSITAKSITLDYLSPTFLLSLLVIGLVTGLAAGSYPAFYLSSFEPVETLKGKLKSKWGEVFARKGLVVFQFTMSVVLIISSLIVYLQIQFVQGKNLGYEKENLISFNIEGDLRNGSWDIFQQKVKEVSGVINISNATSSFLGRNSNTSGLSWPNKQPDVDILFENIGADYGLIETMGFEVVAGRSHSKEFGTDSAKIVINESAVKTMGLDEPVGSFITLWDEETEVIGVVKNFNFQSLHQEVEPLFFRLIGSPSINGYIRISNENIQQTIAEVGRLYKEFNPRYPFDYDFMDQEYAALYRSEQRIGDLSKYFSIIAIIISCLGLFGLSAFTAEQRAKEIGVRKVLGATVQNLVLLLTKDFTRLVIIGILIAIPISWWAMDHWLSDFAYRITLKWWVFVLAGIAAILVSWLTVSWQSIKAALANPVKSLKSE